MRLVQWTTAEHQKATTIEGWEMGGDRYQSNSKILKFNSETKREIQRQLGLGLGLGLGRERWTATSGGGITRKKFAATLRFTRILISHEYRTEVLRVFELAEYRKEAAACRNEMRSRRWETM